MFEGFFDLANFPKDSSSLATMDIKKFFGVTLPNMIYNNDKDMDVSKITQTANIRTKQTESVLKNDWKKGAGNLGDRLAAKQAACEAVGNGDQFDQLSSLASTEDANSRIRCGWVYNNAKPSNGRGAFGTSEGPFKTSAKGNWMWNLDNAKEKYHTSICSGVQGCQDIDSNIYKQRCGWCVKSGKAVPIINGGTAYPYKTNTACPASKLITKGSKCPPPPALDDPTGPRAPGEACIPLQNGALPRDCLIQKLTAAGCSDKGSMAQALRSGSNNDYTNVLRQEEAYRMFQQRAAIPLDDTALKTGKITISDALNNFQRVEDQATSEANSGLQYAARDLCLNKGALDQFDFCSELQDTSSGPFKPECIIAAFGKEGGQIGSTINTDLLTLPLTKNAQVMKNWNALGNWRSVKEKIKDIKRLTNSTNRGTQEKAMLDFYGIRIQNKRNPLPDGPEMAWKDTWVVTSCQRPLPIPEDYNHAGCIDDEKDETFEKWMKDWAGPNGWAMGTPPPIPYKTLDAYDFPGNDIKCEHVGTNNGGFGSEATFGKPRRECDANPDCVSHNEFHVNGHFMYCLKHNSNNGHSMAEHAWWREGNKHIRIHMKNPRRCNPPFVNPPDEAFGWKYRGCWKDTGDRAVPHHIGQAGSVAECVAYARSRGYNTAAIQYYGQCFAGNNPHYQRYGDAGCCEAMGGAWTQQVYSVKTPQDQPLTELQEMWENAGCTSKLQEGQQVEWWRARDTTDIMNDMNAYASLTKNCTGNKSQHEFCRPGKCQ
jgi:hypothetical protein